MANPLNLNIPDTFEVGTPMQGASVGVIYQVHGADAAGEGFAENISYDVVVESAEGPCVVPNQLPAHRRPVRAPGLIVAARPGDMCVVCSSGSNRRFIIFEGIALGTCE